MKNPHWGKKVVEKHDPHTDPGHERRRREGEPERKRIEEDKGRPREGGKSQKNACLKYQD